jgi:hypothetical protein
MTDRCVRCGGIAQGVAYAHVNGERVRLCHPTFGEHPTCYETWIQGHSNVEVLSDQGFLVQSWSCALCSEGGDVASAEEAKEKARAHHAAVHGDAA